MERALDSRAIVLAEFTDLLDDVIDVMLADDNIRHPFHAVAVTRLGRPSIVQDDFDKPFEIRARLESFAHDGWKDV